VTAKPPSGSPCRNAQFTRNLNGTRKIPRQLFLFIKALDELWKLKEGRR